MLGFFWKKTTSKAAIAGITGGFLLSVLFDKYLPLLAGHDTLLYTAYNNGNGVFEIPFLVSMGWVFFFTVALMTIISLLDKKGMQQKHTIEKDPELYKVDKRNLALIILVLGILAALYIRFW